ncbi:MAG TPA: hypothetical protein VFP98_03350 [Candidatus Polarisedimenticolia bacterium]|nr:hypothetical protein [Candidatus Polarisedimenticolia bacterium]
MRAKPVAVMTVFVAAAALAGCSHVQWAGKNMAGPAKRRNASEETAVRALDRFFQAATDMIALSETGIHDACLNAFWEKGALDMKRKRTIGKDRVCALVVDRYDDATGDLAGYGESPSGEYPWLGDVFEYVVRAETVRTKNEKMASIDRYTINKFEVLVASRNSPIVANIVRDYFIIRGTCCRDVTEFDDWYKRRFKQVSAR